MSPRIITSIINQSQSLIFLGTQNYSKNVFWLNNQILWFICANWHVIIMSINHVFWKPDLSISLFSLIPNVDNCDAVN